MRSGRQPEPDERPTHALAATHLPARPGALARADPYGRARRDAQRKAGRTMLADRYVAVSLVDPEARPRGRILEQCAVRAAIDRFPAPSRLGARVSDEIADINSTLSHSHCVLSRLE